MLFKTCLGKLKFDPLGWRSTTGAYRKLPGYAMAQ